MAVAVLCKHCGSHLEAEARPQAAAALGPDTLGWVLLGVPVAATMLIWFWVGHMNLFQSPTSSLGLVMVGTVLGTAMLAAFDAGQLGMGSERDLTAGGRRRGGPSVWFFGFILFWLIAYPLYLHRRRLYGRKSMVVGGLFLAFLVTGSALLMTLAIQTKTAELQQILRR